MVVPCRFGGQHAFNITEKNLTQTDLHVTRCSSVEYVQYVRFLKRMLNYLDSGRKLHAPIGSD